MEESFLSKKAAARKVILRIGAVIGALTVILWSSSGNAEFSDRFNFSSFGALSLSVVDDDKNIIRKTLSTPNSFNGSASWLNDSMIGGQIDARLSDTVTAGLQLVLRDRWKNNLENSVEWAFLRWKPTPSTALRAGRLGADYYMLADYRNVGFGYLWQRPPVEFYGAGMIESFDGIDLSYSLLLGDATLTLKGFGGVTNPYAKTDNQLPENELDVFPILGARLSYGTVSWQFSISYAQGKIDTELPSLNALYPILTSPVTQAVWPQAPSLGAMLSPVGKYYRFHGIGFLYDQNDWVLQTELGYFKTEWIPQSSLFIGYLSLGRRLGSYTPYLLLGVAKPEGSPVGVSRPPGGIGLDPVYNVTFNILNRLRAEQLSLSLGLRKNLSPNLALKVQWDHTWVSRGGSLFYWRDNLFSAVDTTPSPGFEVDMISISLNWMFN